MADIFLGVADSIIAARNTDNSIYHGITYLVRPYMPEESLSLSSDNVFSDIRKRLFGARLMELYATANEMRGLGAHNTWSLTEYGQRQYGLLIRRRRNDAVDRTEEK